ncbi:extracellular solute-binding protein [Paenibacillus sp. LMG 31461]|uniref:Extracellular solute-binding protein n=1 Tax=Paenibacillus plantarum TaxID=2654975 RepID=A0ABX1XAI7_9BACL|nr:extracellular solute-binding protein [Paenibacillus plantarum]NOU65387.1 extracellular solute-binding protein [Paenibacillus plantarum]
MGIKGFRIGFLYMLIAVLITITACSKGEQGDGDGDGDGQKTSPTPATSDTVNSSDQPLGRMNPTIEVTAARDVSGVKFRDGESLENNVWSRAYEEMLGIKVKYVWTMQGTQGEYDQKLNVSIASGDLPDIFAVNSTQMKQLVESNQIADLTEVYNKYASELTKKIMGMDPLQMKSASSKGKLIALPKVGSASDSAQVLWIRQDWLDNLGLSAPRTLADVEAIAKAFVTRDPDGNKVADTLGIAVGQQMTKASFASLKGFFNGYHAYPNQWFQDKNGKFVYGSVQPEAKAALAKLSEMFKVGLIDPEFIVKAGDKNIEQLAGGKVGIEYGAWWNPTYPLQSNIDKDPKARWVAYGIPSADSTPAKAQFEFPVSKYIAVRKGAAHPEAAVKMLNLMFKKAYEDFDVENYFIAKDGFLYNTYPLLYGSKPNGSLDIHLNLMKALDSKNASSLNAEEAGYYAKILDYQKGDLKQWYEEGMYGKTSAWPSVKEKIDQNLVHNPGFYGPATKTMSQKGGVLTKMEDETFTKIIMGEVSIDEFDTFVQNWHKLGGDEIAKEVTEWNSNL